MKNLLKSTIIFILIMPVLLSGQHTSETTKSIDHHEFKNFRVALLIGHTLIPEQHANQNFFIPSWGLDLEYWVNDKWGIGIHSDLEIETFVIIKEEDMEVDRVMPLVLTLDALVKPWKGLVLQIGPGIELEKDENYKLMRIGAEYEIEVNNHWDIAPTIFYDTRFDEYHTWSIALGIGKRF